MLTSVHQPFDVRIFYKETKTLSSYGYFVVLIAQHEREETVDGVKIVPLPKPRNRFTRMVKVVAKAFKLALKEKADVYHFHDPELIPVGLLLKLCGKKIIYDVHEHYPNSILGKYWIPRSMRKIVSLLFSLFEQIFVSFFDYIIYTTRIVGQRYEKKHVPSISIENYPIIALLDNYSKNPQKYILYLGGMTKIRGVLELIHAFGCVVQRHADWKLLFVGKATPESFQHEIDALILSLHLTKNVEMVPWVSYDKKEEYSAKASMGVVTYLSYPNNISCLPNKLFDYMLMSLPVVASNFPLYKEVIDESQCGIIVDPSNPDEIAKAITYLIEHPEEAVHLGNNGRRAVEERYNWEVEGKKLLEVYRNIFETNEGKG